MKLTLQKVRTAKNGLASYKANRKRTNGTVYVDKKMFGDGQAPESITIEAEGLVEPQPETAPAAQAQPEQEGQPVNA